MTLKAARLDNRGTSDLPFGFVYLTDRQGRDAGRIGYGAHRNNPDPLAIWTTADTPTLDDAAISDVRHMLASAFPRLVAAP